MREELQAILYSPHHVSKTRPAMSKIGREAKFSAFKALEGHEDKIAPSGPLHLDTEQQHTAQHELTSNGHHRCKQRERMQETHVEGDEVVVHRHPETNRVNGFRETGEQKEAP